MNIPEFSLPITYTEGDVVWYGELAYVADPTGSEDWFVCGEIPEDSENWKVYWREAGKVFMV